ncbi:MAG: ABC transporter ATP-binding protein [Chloroflexota bacterium]
MENVTFQSIAATPIPKRQLIISALLSILSSAFGLFPYVAIYLIASHLFNSGITNADSTYILMIAGGALAAAIAKGATLIASLHLSHVAAYDILYHTRLAIAQKLSSLSLGFFDRHNTGTIKRVIHEDVEKMEEGLAHIIPDLASALAVPSLSFLLLLFIDWRLALVLLIAPIIGLFVFGIMARFNSSEEIKTYYAIMDRMNSTFIQYLNGMKVIKAFTRSRSSFADLKQIIDEMIALFDTMAVGIQRSYAGIPVAFRAGPLFVLPIGLLLYLNNSLDLPTLTLFLIMSLGFARPIHNFIMRGMLAFYQIHTAMGRIDQLLGEPSLPETDNPEQPNGYGLAFHHVSFDYAASDSETEMSRHVLDNVSFTIAQGSVTALVGPSGAGKTTIARLIPRFWDVNEGHIEIGGVDIRQMATADLMDHVSFVFQDVFLFNDTIYENIRVGKPDATREQIISAAKMARCHAFIEELGGYDYHVGENGAKLSGGQRQRLSIARAILKNTPIIVLDEATAFVDPENESLIQAALATLLNSRPDRPKTLVVVAHRLSTITAADQILVVDGGKIAAAGRHAELLASSELYQMLWDAHTDANKWRFDSDAEVETLTINRNTTYDGESLPLDNPFAGLSRAKGHLGRVNALVAGERSRFRRGILWSFLEGVFIANPMVLLYLAMVVLFEDTLSTGTVALLTGGLVLAFAFQYLFSFLSYVTFIRVDMFTQRRLRIFLSDYLRRLPLGFFTTRDVGYIDALFTTTIEFLETRFSTTLFISSVVSPALIFIFALFIDWRMALAMAVSVPVAVLFLRRTMHVFDEVWRVQRKARKDANSRMVEYIQGIRVIRAFNLSGKRFEQFDHAMDQYRIASRNTITRITPAMTGFSFVLEIGFALMLIAGGGFVIAETLTFAQFLIFMLLGISFFAPMMALADMLSIQRIMANGINRINEFLSSPILPEPETSKRPAGYEIAFKDVHFSYEEENVLNGVSFTIPENAMVALVGPSGSGKTTVTNLIARFWDVKRGSVTLGGIDLREMTSDLLLSHITLVFQDVYLFNDTIMHNIRFANPAATDEQVFGAARIARAHDFIIEMPDGYETTVGEGGSTLSGGQKQRISIARAILKDAPIVLLDEATASIDPENERLIQQAFNVLVKNKTVIIIAHRLSTVQSADMILVLDKGQIVQQGRHRDLLAQDGMYQRFWEERQKSRSWKLTGANTADRVADLGFDQ